jgi:hypothetical protein
MLVLGAILRKGRREREKRRKREKEEGSEGRELGVFLFRKTLGTAYLSSHRVGSHVSMHNSVSKSPSTEERTVGFGVDQEAESTLAGCIKWSLSKVTV